MSYQIITRITITPDLRVMVRMAANNIRPLDFRYDEVVSLTEMCIRDRTITACRRSSGGNTTCCP